MRILLLVLILGGIVYGITFIFDFEEPAPLVLTEPDAAQPAAEPEVPPANLRLNEMGLEATPSGQAPAPEALEVAEPEPVVETGPARAAAPETASVPTLSSEDQQRVQDLESFFSEPANAPRPTQSTGSTQQQPVARSSLQRLREQTYGEQASEGDQSTDEASGGQPIDESVPPEEDNTPVEALD